MSINRKFKDLNIATFALLSQPQSPGRLCWAASFQPFGLWAAAHLLLCEKGRLVTFFTWWVERWRLQLVWSVASFWLKPNWDISNFGSGLFLPTPMDDRNLEIRKNVRGFVSSVLETLCTVRWVLDSAYLPLGRFYLFKEFLKFNLFTFFWCTLN